MADQTAAAEEAVAGILLTSVGARNVAELAATIVAAVHAALPAHEWECPACGATTRARMADHHTIGARA